MTRRRILSAGPLLSLALLQGCTSVQNLRVHTSDPTVVLHGPGGDELGVSTDYGIVFLGRYANRGRVEFTTWFGDGPSLEEGVVEPLGDGLFTTSAEIQLSNVTLLFHTPDPGEPVVVRGRGPNGPYELEAEVASDPRVEGLLLAPSPELDGLAEDQLGAGVFLVGPAGRKQLIGLVTGRIRLRQGDGSESRYVTASGPEQLWRLVVHQRNSERPRRAVPREDIL